jgi:hypothetical protein
LFVWFNNVEKADKESPLAETDTLTTNPKSKIQNPKSQRPRIIAMTAYAMAGDRYWLTYVYIS